MANSGLQGFKRGEQAKPAEDEKTLNHRVDQAVKQRTHKPKATHPWKKIPITRAVTANKHENTKRTFLLCRKEDISTLGLHVLEQVVE